jgi:hypothetical protein
VIYFGEDGSQLACLIALLGACRARLSNNMVIL